MIVTRTSILMLHRDATLIWNHIITTLITSHKLGKYIIMIF